MPVVDDPIKRIDPKKRIIEFESGLTAPLGDRAAFEYTATPSAKKTAEEEKQSQLSFQKSLESVPGGQQVNAFLKKVGDSALIKIGRDYLIDPVRASVESAIPKEGQEGLNYFQRMGENLLSKRFGRREAEREIYQQQPGAAAAGSIGALATDIATPLGPLGKSPAAAGALYGATAPEKSLYEDPGEVATSAAIGGGLGYGIGKGVEKAERVALERQAIREFPEIEKQAAKQYARDVQQFRKTQMGKLKAVERDVEKYGVPKSVIGVDEFIRTNLGLGPIAGTPEAKSLSVFLRGVEKNLPRELKTKDIVQMYEAIEGRAAAASEGEKAILTEFKNHLVETIPVGAAENKILGKIYPKLEKEVTGWIEKEFSKLPKDVKNTIEKVYGEGSVKRLEEMMKSRAMQGFSAAEVPELLKILESRDPSNIVNRATDFDLYRQVTDMRSQLTGNLLTPQMARNVSAAETRMQNIANRFSNHMEKVLDKVSPEANILMQETVDKVTSKMSNATGVTSPTSGRSPTNVPVGPYSAPQKPQVGALARRFEEKPLQMGQRARSGAMLGAIGRLFGMPKLGAIAGAGKAAGAALEGVVRGITSPDALGKYARRGVQQAGIPAVVDQIASTYPSYDRGILTDPRDRLDAVAEIEDDPDLGIEDKAVIQAYINRGKSIEKLLR